MGSRSFAVVGSDLDLMDDMKSAGYEVLGYFSTRDKNFDFNYLGDHSNINEHPLNLPLVVATDNPEFREFLWISYASRISKYISPLAHISRFSEIGVGAVIYPHAYISSGVDVGKLVKVSVFSQIHHECKIGEFSVIAPQSLILGRVSIGVRTFIGSGCRIAPNIRIGNDSLLGMGSVLLKDIGDHKKVWGHPAREVENL